MKSIKEKELLVNFARAMGQAVDPKLAEEVDRINAIRNSVKASVSENIFKDLGAAVTTAKNTPAPITTPVEGKQEEVLLDEKTEVKEIQFPVPPTLDELLLVLNEQIEEVKNELVQAQTQEESAKTKESISNTPEINSPAEVVAEQTIADKTSDFISKSKDSFQQPDPLKIAPDLDAITKKLRFLEQWISKVSMSGPGGGEVRLRNLDDVDRATIGDGKYLNYNATSGKFQFSTLSGGGAPQVQADWDQSSNTEPSFIKNKPAIYQDHANNLVVLASNIVPADSVTLGTPSKPFQDAYFGPHSISILPDSVTGLPIVLDNSSNILAVTGGGFAVYDPTQTFYSLLVDSKVGQTFIQAPGPVVGKAVLNVSANPSANSYPLVNTVAGGVAHFTGGTRGATLMTVDNFDNLSHSTGPVLSHRRFRGTPDIPQAVQSTDLLGGWLAAGYNSYAANGISTTSYNGIRFIATENYDSTGLGSKLEFLLYPNGTNASVVVANLNPSGSQPGLTLVQANSGITFTDSTFQPTAAYPVTTQDEGSNLTVTTKVLNFVGAGVTANATANIVTVNIPGVNDILSATHEPMGHENRLESNIAFNNSTRTFSISPINTNYNVWVSGTKYNITDTRTVNLPNTTGLYYIYYSNTGILSYQTSYFDWPNQAPTAYVYWNANTNSAPFVADERHGVVLDWQTHEYLHRTRGAVIANGFNAGNYTTTGTGNANTDMQLDIADGTFFDEDLQVSIVNSNIPTPNTWQQDLQGPARIPMFYLSGTGWVIDPPTNYPVKLGSARPQYNLDTGGVWSTADIDNNKYGVTFILATNNINYPVIGIIAQSQRATKGDAESLQFSDLTLTGLPIVEMRLLYKLVYYCSNNYTNYPKATLNSIWDLRSFSSVVQAAATTADHGLLTGLSHDDHPQYLHTEVTRTANANITFTGNINFTSNLKTSNIIVTGNYTGVEVSSTYGGMAITNSRGNMLIGNNTRDGVARYALNTANGIYAGVQVQRAGAEKWFFGANQSDHFIIKNNGTVEVFTVEDTSNVSINTNGYVTQFRNDGTILLPSNILNTGSNPATIWSNNSSSLKWRNTGFSPTGNAETTISSYSGAASIVISTGLLGIGTTYYWYFDKNNITFPDGTAQATAFTNAVLTTANVIESASNLYYTNARVYANVSPLLITKANVSDLTTANVREISSNLYFTNARVYANVSPLLITKANVADLTTANVLENTNLYFTNARAISGVTNTTLSNLTVSGAVNTATSITSNAATAFIAGNAAESGVALQVPREGGIRNLTNGVNNMYFDVSNGGTSDGGFIFRSSSAFTELLYLSTSGLRATSAYKAKQFNGALDSEVSSDNLKFRVSNQGGVFPQIGSTTGSNIDVSWTIEGYVNGSGTLGAQNSGVLINSYTSLYTAHGLDTRGDMVVATVVDKNAGKIYRVTFVVSNNSNNTTGYSIVIERII